MSERRSVIAPPEITNGSRSGSASSNSSARAIRVIVIYAAPRQDPETKRNRHEQPADGDESFAPTRRDQPCDGSDGEPEHDHQEVRALDPVTLSQPPHPIGQEDDNPEASQHGDRGPTRPRPGWIDAAAPCQDAGEHEKRESSQTTTFVHRLCPSSGQSRAACLRARQSEIQMADGTAAMSNPSPTITHRAASARNQPAAANTIPK